MTEMRDSYMLVRKDTRQWVRISGSLLELRMFATTVEDVEIVPITITRRKWAKGEKNE